MKLLSSVLAIALFFSPETPRQTFDSAMQALNSGDYPAACMPRLTAMARPSRFINGFCVSAPSCVKFNSI